MKLKAITLENFRGFRDRTRIEIESGLTAFIGKNDAGKSTILDALDAFFNGRIDKNDACVTGDASFVCVSCEFADFPGEVILDAKHPTTLEREYLLNSRGNLEIERVFDCTLQKPKAKQFAVANHPHDVPYADLLELKIDKLKARAKMLQLNLDRVNQTISSEVRHAIWESAKQNCVERRLLLDKEDGKRIGDALDSVLPMFTLFKADRPSTDQDAEAQEPMRAVIRDAIAELVPNFEAIRNEISNRLLTLAQQTVHKIAEIDPQIAQTLNPRVEAKKLDSLFSVSLASENEIPLNKRGSGVRRLVLLGFFRAEAERRIKDGENISKSVIYAIEEPETSQHPSNQVLILSALKDFAASAHEQVIVTTHNPVLASRLDESCIRYVRHSTSGTAEVVLVNNDSVRRDIIDSLGVLPDHRVRLILEVEGPNDVAFYKNVTRNLARLDPAQYVDFNQAEQDGALLILSMGGSTLQNWVNNMAELARPIFHALDRDTIPPNPPHYEKEAQMFKDAGHRVFITSRREIENYIPVSLLRMTQPEYVCGNAHFDDVVARYSEASKRAVEKAPPEQRSKLRSMKPSVAKSVLNNRIAALINTNELFDEGDPEGELRDFIREVSKGLRG